MAAATFGRQVVQQIHLTAQLWWQPIGLNVQHQFTFWSFSSVQCCFTTTETMRTIRDGEPGTGSPGRPSRLSHNAWARQDDVQCFKVVAGELTWGKSSPLSCTSYPIKVIFQERSGRKLVDFLFTRLPGESYRRRIRTVAAFVVSLLLKAN